LPHSDACFVVGYPAETTEAFCDGHVRAFAFFGGVPKSIVCDYVSGHITQSVFSPAARPLAARLSAGF
jgi:transposase